MVNVSDSLSLTVPLSCNKISVLKCLFLSLEGRFFFKCSCCFVGKYQMLAVRSDRRGDRHDDRHEDHRGDSLSGIPMKL